MFVKISNQKFKRVTCFNKNKLVTKTTIVKSNTIAIKKFFVVINSQELSNKKYNNFNNKFLIKDELETNTSFTFNNFEINYKTLLKKKREKSKQLVVKYKYQLLLKEN